MELSGSYQLSDKWRLRGGYTYFDKKLQARPGHTFDPSYLGNDVKHQVLLHSMLNITDQLNLDIAARYLGALEKTLATTAVPAYFTFDARLAFYLKQLEISVTGQNLFEKNHQEFGSLNIPRSIYGKITLRL
jgi:iron complex outermembrane receptor protein